MRKSKGRGEKTATNGRARIVKRESSGMARTEKKRAKNRHESMAQAAKKEGAGGEKARKKTAREWSLRKREFWHGAGREKVCKKIGAGVGVERWKGLAHKINARRARERLTICRQTTMIFLKKHNRSRRARAQRRRGEGRRR